MTIQEILNEIKARATKGTFMMGAYHRDVPALICALERAIEQRNDYRPYWASKTHCYDPSYSKNDDRELIEILKPNGSV